MCDLINEPTFKSAIHLLENNNRTALGVKHIVAEYFIVCRKSTAMSRSSEMNSSRILINGLCNITLGKRPFQSCGNW